MICEHDSDQGRLGESCRYLPWTNIVTVVQNALPDKPGCIGKCFKLTLQVGLGRQEVERESAIGRVPSVGLFLLSDVRTV